MPDEPLHEVQRRALGLQDPERAAAHAREHGVRARRRRRPRRAPRSSTPRCANTSRATSSPHTTSSCARLEPRLTLLVGLDQRERGRIARAEVLGERGGASLDEPAARSDAAGRRGAWRSSAPGYPRSERVYSGHLRLEARDLLADQPLAELRHDLPHDRLDALQRLRRRPAPRARRRLPRPPSRRSARAGWSRRSRSSARRARAGTTALRLGGKVSASGAGAAMRGAGASRGTSRAAGTNARVGMGVSGSRSLVGSIRRVAASARDAVARSKRGSSSAAAVSGENGCWHRLVAGRPRAPRRARCPPRRARSSSDSDSASRAARRPAGRAAAAGVGLAAVARRCGSRKVVWL